MRKSIPFEERFSDKYVITDPNSGCWLWYRSRTKDGYGQFSHKGRMFRSHRVAYELYKGEIPEGSHVLHKCDIPCCVNPDHLFLGTHNDNMKDMIKKGRSYDRSGVNNPNCKLTEEQIREIRSKYIKGVYDSGDLSDEYGVTKNMILNIINKTMWLHI